ncbi:MAG TPA: hypothetical protein VHC91_24465 [Trinickia sp.]|uniref:hypothetical protein n=1 Tax=Trinickia sp. TaxID=2571163 RepID=UPI002BA4BE9F|nr:hypothetical protein [Trinickia sp.]HVW53523.1 hypothetical protein [Trinickia sp.]
MNKKLVAVMFGVGIAALGISKAASAHVNLAVGIGIPSPVYVAPEPVYVAPPQVAYAPAPVVTGYWGGGDGWREREWRRREWREHQWREHEWREHHGWGRGHD